MPYVIREKPKPGELIRYYNGEHRYIFTFGGEKQRNVMVRCKTTNVKRARIYHSEETARRSCKRFNNNKEFIETEYEVVEIKGANE